MKWNKGKPPAIDWYPTMKIRGRGWDNSYRWWDGECWSWPAFPHETAGTAGRWAQHKEVKGHNREIMWGTPQVIN